MKKTLLSLLVGIGMFSQSAYAQSGSNDVLDCALRDAPFSTDLPLYDLITRPKAKAVINKHYPGLVASLPPFFVSESMPSFATIITFENLLDFIHKPKDQLAKVDEDLRELALTHDDKVARCARYDNEAQDFALGDEDVQILVYQKINGFDHGESVTAATQAMKTLGEDLGYGVTVTAKGGAFTAETLDQFDMVVWNNVSGDTLTLSQRQAFRDYIEQGGGFLGIHASGGDSIYFWDWYRDTLLGAQFIGHPNDPQFQDADVHVVENASGLARDLAPGWTMKEEWYSFDRNPRDNGADIILTLDESTYQPGPLAMNNEHPLVWTQCVGKGRSMFTAIGHRKQMYDIEQNISLLKQGMTWVVGKQDNRCQ